MKKITLLIPLLFFAACAKAGFVAANFPSHFSAMQSVKDVSYGALPAQSLDMYTPQGDATGKHPVVVFFYGGRWTDGSKSDYLFVADRFTRAGYIVVIPDYRKYPKVHFPVFVEDGAAAITWTQKNIASYNGDPAQIFVLGHSAGAHIGALLAADEHYLKDAGAKLPAIRAFAGLAGPYAFTPDEPDLKDMFGPPEKYPLMQVTSFIDGTEPPMLLLHGQDDTTVKFVNFERLRDKIREKGGSVQTKLYPGLDHVGIIAALTWLKDGGNVVANDILAFFEAHKTAPNNR